MELIQRFALRIVEEKHVFEECLFSKTWKAAIMLHRCIFSQNLYTRLLFLQKRFFVTFAML